MLNVLDEFTHECLAIRVARKLKAIDVIDVLSDLFILRGVPGHIRSDNGPEFVAEAVQEWIRAIGAKTAYIERGSPWENGYIESFNARLRDELFISAMNRKVAAVCASNRRSSRTICSCVAPTNILVRPKITLIWSADAPAISTDTGGIAGFINSPVTVSGNDNRRT